MNNYKYYCEKCNYGTYIRLEQLKEEKIKLMIFTKI